VVWGLRFLFHRTETEFHSLSIGGTPKQRAALPSSSDTSCQCGMSQAFTPGSQAGRSVSQ